MRIDDEAAAIDRGTYTARTPWDDPAWRREALGWAAEELTRCGLKPAGAVDVRIRPWSVGFRIALQDGGAAWFKANPPASAFEPALAAALPGWVPGQVLEPLAVDTARAWALLPDGGPLLREVLDGDAQDDADAGHDGDGGQDRDGDARGGRARGRAERGMRAWEDVLGRYGEFQRGLVPYAGEILALGVPDLRPERLADRLALLLDGQDAAPPGAGGLDAGERAALREPPARFLDACATLATSGIPVSLDHSDLHDASVLTGGGGPVFFDWGDAAVAHPFSTLLVVRGAAGARFPGEEGVFARLRDAYLEAWTGLGHTSAELRELVEVACHVGAVARADSWSRTFPAGPDEGGSVLVGHTAHWLRELLR